MQEADLARQNRVTPFGEIEADPARGLFMGNRGCLHDALGHLTTARWRSKTWITCLTAFKNRQTPLAAPGRYTPLFFLDEAVAFASGHRPCAECRRQDFLRFCQAWTKGEAPRPKVAEIDTALHAARLPLGIHASQVRFRIGELPEGTFVILDEKACLLWQGALHSWTHSGYRDARNVLHDVELPVLTPLPLIEVLRNGYRPVVHGSAKVRA